MYGGNKLYSKSEPYTVIVIVIRLDIRLVIRLDIIRLDIRIGVIGTQNKLGKLFFGGGQCIVITSP